MSYHGAQCDVKIFYRWIYGATLDNVVHKSHMCIYIYIYIYIYIATRKRERGKGREIEKEKDR